MLSVGTFPLGRMEWKRNKKAEHEDESNQLQHDLMHSLSQVFTSAVSAVS